MGPSGTGLYTWTPARHVSAPDSDAAHRRRARRLASAVDVRPGHRGLAARVGTWLDHHLRAPALR